jgi:hypothetical protein
MGRYSKKNRKGGEKLDDIQVQVDSIQQQLNDLKASRSSSMSMPEDSMSMSESMENKVDNMVSDSGMLGDNVGTGDNVVTDAIVVTGDSVVKDSKKKNKTKKIVDEVVEDVKYWVKDKNIKFLNGAGGTVSLSFDGIIPKIDKVIKTYEVAKLKNPNSPEYSEPEAMKGTTPWSTIKQKLIDANSVDEVQGVINTYKISFAANYVAGTRRRKSRGKKRTHKRR